MKRFLTRAKNISNKCGALFFLSATFILLFSSSALSQMSVRQTWDGPYDIKMIAAPNLQAAYLNSSQASSGNLKVDSLIRHSTMIMAGKNILEINNRYKGGSPFVQVAIPIPAFACPNPDAACMLGLNQITGTSSCPTKYDDPLTISKYVSMTYSDYDGDNSTYSSSMSELDISSCSEIAAAYLYWTGAFQTHGSSNPGITLVPTAPFNSYAGAPVANSSVFNVTTTSGFETIKFKRPGGTYQNVTATGLNVTISDSRYLCIADVTALVSGTGGGQFWAANIQSYPNEDAIGGGGSTSGWVLVVIFKSPLSPPRLISLWDGLTSISQNTSETFTLTGLQAPATTNFQSYVGFAALDGENLAGQLADLSSPDNIPEGLGFQTNAGGSFVSINPFKTDQPHYKLWNKKGVPAKSDGTPNTDACKKPLFDGNWATVYDGVSSSHITTYDPVTNTNGNEMTRLPTNPNTLGLDVHHMKLPNGSVAPGATTATLTVNAGPQGGTSPFLAYLAIERLQPKLIMTKTASVNTTTPGSTISYTLKIKNVGNTASLGNDHVYDTLDAATTYTAGSLTSKRYVNGAVTTPAPGVSIASSTGGKLDFLLANPILMNDSIWITFTVDVVPLPNALYSAPTCKRTIENTAWAKYGTATAGLLLSKSNSNDCGIGSETKVLITGFTNPTTVIGPFNACPFINETVIPHVQSALIGAGVSASVVNEFDIRTSTNVRVQTTDIFSSVSPTMSYFAYRDFVSGGNCQQIYEIKYTSCNLPVTLVSFTGSKENNLNMLVWLTASEKNNDYFMVETSVNGKDFISLGTVQGNGNSSTTHTYQFNAEHPLNGINYYRLKQVDFNGSVSYSAVIAIDNKEVDMDIYPNPNHGAFTIRFIAPGESYKLDVTDVLGKTVYSIYGHTVPESIEVNDLAKGVYLVRFYQENKVIIKKMMVY
jgi:uncharacterized repeat protein (TIGR01451 family)